MKLKQLHEAATPGPWKWLQFNKKFGARRFIVPEKTGEPDVYPLVIGEIDHGFATLDLIITLRNAVPEILELIEAATGYLKEQERTYINADDFIAALRAEDKSEERLSKAIAAIKEKL